MKSFVVAACIVALNLSISHISYANTLTVGDISCMTEDAFQMTTEAHLNLLSDERNVLYGDHLHYFLIGKVQRITPAASLDTTGPSLDMIDQAKHLACQLKFDLNRYGVVDSEPTDIRCFTNTMLSNEDAKIILHRTTSDSYEGCLSQMM